MSHVLLGGDEQQLTELRCLLARWGVTAGPLAFADDAPTVLDCDAVILYGNCDKYLAACLGAAPDGSRGAAGPAAPLIFINSNSVSVATLPSTWQVLESLGDQGTELRLSLRSALALGRQLRSGFTEPGTEHDAAWADSYLHFLGHELRSPLTVIKTSLEVLAAELGGVEKNPARPDARLKMVDIALRNVGRLHQTVEWSQDLAASGNSAEGADLCAIVVDELADHLQATGDVWVESAAGDSVVETDPKVLAQLVTQMTRAVGMACPASPVAIRLAVDPHDQQRLRLMVAAEGAGTGANGNPRTTRLMNSSDHAGLVAELDRLARFMVATCLVDSLGAKLAATTAGGDCPALVLMLNLSDQPALVH